MQVTLTFIACFGTSHCAEAMMCTSAGIQYVVSGCIHIQTRTYVSVNMSNQERHGTSPNFDMHGANVKLIG